jgi:hypothetical protein
MNRAAVVSIAMACMLVAAVVAFTDPTRGGQTAAFGIGLVAAAVLCVGIISESGGSWGSTRGDTTQHTNIYIDGTPRQPQGSAGHELHPAYYAPPASAPAQPQIIVMPMPGYPPVGYGHAPHPGYLQAPQHGGYLAAPEYAAPPAIQHHPQPQYRGAIDVVAEPVRYPPQQGQIRHGQAPRLESPEAGFIRRAARKIVG